MQRQRRKRPSRRKPHGLTIAVGPDWDVELVNALALAGMAVANAASHRQYLDSLGHLCAAAMRFSLDVLRRMEPPSSAVRPN
jgi:hypothetical protein